MKRRRRKSRRRKRRRRKRRKLLREIAGSCHVGQSDEIIMA